MKTLLPTKNEGLEFGEGYVWGKNFSSPSMARCALLVFAIVALHSDLRGWPSKAADGNTLSGQILANRKHDRKLPQMVGFSKGKFPTISGKPRLLTYYNLI